MEPQDSAAEPAVVSGILRPDSDAVYQPPLRSRLGMLGVSAGLVLLALGAAPLLARLVFDPDVGLLPLRCMTAAVWLVLVAYSVYMALTVRNRFVVGVDSVSLRTWRSTRTLRFEDIAGGTVELVDIRQPNRAPRVRGARLTLRSRHAGEAPLSVVFDERLPIDAAIVERLAALPALPRHLLKPLERASVARGGPR